jgi:hypothetical protein
MKRWYHSRTIWLNLTSGLVDLVAVLAAVIVSVAPQALSMISTIGLTPVQLMVWTLGLNVLVKLANIWLRHNSPAAILNKDEATAFHNFNDVELDGVEPFERDL